MAYISFHTHQVWPNLMQDLTQNLSTNLQGVKSLLAIIAYMANECEDEQIVIEESLRESFFDFVDTVCASVFKDVFNHWADCSL